MKQTFSGSTSGQGRTLELTGTEYHRLLSDERRRVALAILEAERTPIDLTELATAVATQEDDTDVPEDEHVERVATALHHNHLPKMDQLNVVDYDPSTKRITLEE